ncbi:hypothetical protein [Streptomyces californicus]|uniref:hypothetical protein n=1 Tax=Streptomyces californicus TaxID=67351 RepID=UPI00379B3CC7
MIKQVLREGLIAGAAGSVAMTFAEKLEQADTPRPSSHVPARVLERLTGMPAQSGKRLVAVNLAMHFGQATLLGVLRSLMARSGLRGPVASVQFTVARLTTDQILENATGVGAPPSTWPRKELVIDVVHKVADGFATGMVADALAARGGPGPGQLHAAAHPGRRTGAAPVGRQDAYGR